MNFCDFNDAPRQDDSAPQAPLWGDGHRYDRDEVHTSLMASLEGVLGYLYPSGFADPKGQKFYIGNTLGEAGESLSVELTGAKAGLWHDFATGDGGDIFDLWQAARGLPSFSATLQDAGEFTGATVSTPRRTPTRKSPKGGNAWGAPTQTYRYTDTKGRILAEIERFDWEVDGKKHKTFRPWDVERRRYSHPEIRPLYNLPNIASAPEIIIVEGEKAADALIAENIDATTAMGGSNAPFAKTDWSILRGRKIVIWPDNDDAGRSYAENLKAHLEAEGALAVSILNVPATRPEKWDAADADEDLGALINAMRNPVSREPNASFFTADTLAGIEVPQREWHVQDLIPANQVTMLGGDGGVGKSLLALQLAVSTAAGRDWIGTNPQNGPVVYITAEDEKDELHRRIVAVAEGQVVALESLSRLTLCSLAGENALMAVADTRSGTLTATDRFKEVTAEVQSRGACLVILDTLADLHSGQENDRTVARQFISLLRGLAIRERCAIVLLAHPSLTGISSGSGLSGSTAWSNSVRSRLYLDRVKDDGYEPDPDARVLTTKKANYGPTGTEIHLRWECGMFVPDDSQNSPLDDMASSSKARRVFMDLLDRYTIEGRRVNASGGPNYAPTVMGKDPRREGVTKSALSDAMADLFDIGTIENVAYGPPSKRANQIMRVE